MKNGSVLFRCLVWGLLGGCAGLLSGCRSDTPPAEEEESHPAPVRAVRAQSKVLAEWTELLGAVQPLPGRVARLTSPVAGRVVSVLGGGKSPSLAEGQPVVQGQLLVQLDDRVARAARDKAQALLAELHEQTQQAEYALALARLDLERLEKLQPASVGASGLPLVTRIELERARLALADAESRYRLAQAKVKTAQAELQGLQEQLDWYAIRAPINGRLGLMRVAPGQTLSVGTPITDIFDLSEVDILCFVPPHLMGRLALHQPARLRSPEGSSAASGRVCFLAVQAEAESGNFAVKVRFPNPDLRLRVGRLEHVQVQTQPARARQAVVPAAALIEDRDPPLALGVEDLKEEVKEGKKVKIGRVRRLQAIVGLRTPEQEVELLRLFDPQRRQEVSPQGRWFIIAGGQGLQDGDPVYLEEDEEEEAAP
jgi:RND family efflux transporter MFP subunit